ncbi:hypothetical protein RHMOL_Rhmol03G0121200 [Rhododendron molle]|uniref:Uncharacterized protein n=1 Tax=Rhododendron molle TaxID=49168 RepID=A0ACC0PFV1_RHOML|nr:hypothetical protein RHMOL_Rhmol03G0121200 [Rhododendron molle]
MYQIVKEMIGKMVYAFMLFEVPGSHYKLYIEQWLVGWSMLRLQAAESYGCCCCSIVCHITALFCCFVLLSDSSALFCSAVLVLVIKRKKARSKVPFNHTMGSQSFASAMAAQTHKRGGQCPYIADFYSSTHYNRKKKKWVAPICEQLHKEDEARSQEVDAPGLPITMPQEEMPIEVLGKKFYVKEYGVSLKSSSSKQPSGNP